MQGRCPTEREPPMHLWQTDGRNPPFCISSESPLALPEPGTRTPPGKLASSTGARTPTPIATGFANLLIAFGRILLFFAQLLKALVPRIPLRFFKSLLAICLL